MNLQKQIKDVKGEPLEMSFPTTAEIEKAALENDVPLTLLQGKHMPRETIKNVLLNCLAQYRPATNNIKEVFEINQIALWVSSHTQEDRKELPPILFSFLTKQILPQLTARVVDDEKGNKVNLGLYAPIIMYQVYEELGVQPE